MGPVRALGREPPNEGSMEVEAMRYGSLPEKGNGHGVALVCLNPACSQFDTPWSPDRGDYWYMSDDKLVECGTCTTPMDLVRHREHWERVSFGEAS